MGPDHEIDRAIAQAVDRPLLLALRNEARQQAHARGKRPEALVERPVMLVGKNGRWHEHCHLLAILDRLERSAQSDFGLAVADIPDDESIHRPACLHVELDLGHCPELIDCLLVRE
jgi:hypothetical protein